MLTRFALIFLRKKNVNGQVVKYGVVYTLKCTRVEDAGGGLGGQGFQDKIAKGFIVFLLTH